MKIKKTVVTKSTAAAAKKNAKPAAAPVTAKAQKGQPPVSAQPVAKRATDSVEALNNGINTGKRTGIRVMAFQDLTLATNDQLKRPAPLAHIPGQLTDTELAKVWREEFPNSRAVLAGRIDESIVRGVRNLYNQGKGGHGTPGQTHQSKPWVIGENGKRVQSEYVRARKVGESSNKTAPAAQPKVDTTAVAKKSAKVVTGAAAKAVAAKGKVASSRKAA